VPHIPRIAVPAADAVGAARQIVEALAPADPCLTIVFGAASTDFETLAAHLTDGLPRTRLVGCSTAGEIGPDGLAQDTIVAVGLPAAHFDVSTVSIDLTDPSMDAIVACANAAMAALTPAGHAPTRDTVFAMLFADGLAHREELLASTLHDALGGIRCAAAPRATPWFLHGGRQQRDVRSDSAVLASCTRLPFVVFKTQHRPRGGQADRHRHRRRHRNRGINGEPARRARSSACRRRRSVPCSRTIRSSSRWAAMLVRAGPRQRRPQPHLHVRHRETSR
jgi:hypothetical protein